MRPERVRNTDGRRSRTWADALFSSHSAKVNGVDPCNRVR